MANWKLVVLPGPKGMLLSFVMLFSLPQTKATRNIVGKSAPEIIFQTPSLRSVKLSEFRGKWVFLHYGGAWNRNSQFTGQVFAHIHRALDGKPTVLVDVFDDPTFADVDLFSFSMPAEFRVRVAKSRDSGNLRPSRLPAWYVIDPTGIVRATGGLEEPESLRKKVGGALATDPDFQNVPLAPDPSESMLERAMYLYIKRNYAKSEAEAAEILANDPHNELAIVFLHFAAAWTKGYGGAEKDIDERLPKTHKPSDRLLIHLALYRHLNHATTTTSAAIRSMADQYPESHYLECLRLYLDRLPESLTHQEQDLLVTAKNTALDESMNIYRGYVLQSQGNYGQAEALFRRMRSPKNLALLPLISNLVCQGQLKSASNVLKFPKDLTPDNAGPADAWKKMHSESVLGRWELAARYASRYRTVRPEKLQGLLVEWLAAIMQKQSSRAEELARESEEFAKSSPHYELAASFLAKNEIPSVREIGILSDGNIRFDTALFFILRQWQRVGPDAAISSSAIFQPAFSAPHWQYAFINHLRMFSIPALQRESRSR